VDRPDATTLKAGGGEPQRRLPAEARVELVRLEADSVARLEARARSLPPAPRSPWEIAATPPTILPQRHATTAPQAPPQAVRREKSTEVRLVSATPGKPAVYTPRVPHPPPPALSSGAQTPAGLPASHARPTTPVQNHRTSSPVREMATPVQGTRRTASPVQVRRSINVTKPTAELMSLLAHCPPESVPIVQAAAGHHGQNTTSCSSARVPRHSDSSTRLLGLVRSESQSRARAEERTVHPIGQGVPRTVSPGRAPTAVSPPCVLDISRISRGGALNTSATPGLPGPTIHRATPAAGANDAGDSLRLPGPTIHRATPLQLSPSALTSCSGQATPHQPPQQILQSASAWQMSQQQAQQTGSRLAQEPYAPMAQAGEVYDFDFEMASQQQYILRKQAQVLPEDQGGSLTLTVTHGSSVIAEAQPIQRTAGLSANQLRYAPTPGSIQTPSGLQGAERGAQAARVANVCGDRLSFPPGWQSPGRPPATVR
jgi:hypothetical protein